MSLDIETHYQQLLLSHERIKKYVHKTPVLTSRIINEHAGCEIYFKCENLQKMGAFKIRGATNAVLNLTENQRKFGVVTHSSGNMAQALALAARQIGVPAYIVMPHNAPAVKINAVKQYGGKITFCAPIIQERQAEADKIIKEKGAAFIHPSNDINVILGQGTAGLELINEVASLETIICPVGGGGLLAGTAIACNNKNHSIKCIGGEPEEVNDAQRSLTMGKVQKSNPGKSIADGLLTYLGDVNFPIIKNKVEEIITVSEKEIIRSMKYFWERMKLIIEPSSAVALAVVFKSRSKLKNKKIGIIISGGNVDLTKLPF